METEARPVGPDGHTVISDADLASMRACSLQAMPDTVVVTRPAVDMAGVLNETSGVWTPSAASTIYTGQARVRPAAGLTELVAIFGDDQVTEQRYVGTFPFDAAGFEVGDLVAVTDGSDPTIVSAGRFRVVRVPVGTWQIDRRVGLELVQ